MIKMTCGICKGSGHVGPDSDMVTEQPCCQCNGSGVVFVVAPAQPATNTGSPKCPECGGLRVVPKGDGIKVTRYELCPVCEGFGTLRAGA
jgi:DnaJ-class molecular chaperone